MAKQKFSVSCDAARKRGAIGIFGRVQRTIEAETKEEAVEDFRVLFETNAPVRCVNAAQVRFAGDYGMNCQEVDELVTLATWAARGNEGECNGDPHADSTNRQDKNANAKCWAADVERITRQIEALVKPYGFTAVVYTGLGPTLKRGEQFVEIPY